MTRDSVNLPNARTWREIPQPVVPRAMSREGQWRLLMAAVRIAAASVIGGGALWAGWLVFAAVRENVRVMPAAARATPLRAPELRTDGVLDGAWLARTLALPAKTTLLELDLQKLRTRLLAEQQVATATLTKNFPDRLVVTISERNPVARVMTQMLGQKRALLVARDGVIYVGEGYDRATLETLPWLDGVKIVPAGGGFRPIAGMEQAAELLSKARLEAEHLYSTWGVISLARLATDRKLEVRTKDGRVLVYFTTNDDFFRQLAKLDYIADALGSRDPAASAVIDLSLGQDVPVMVTPAPAEEPAASGPRRVARLSSASTTRDEHAAMAFRPDLPADGDRPASHPTLFVPPHPQFSQPNREL